MESIYAPHNYIEGKVIRLNNHIVEHAEVEGKSINIHMHINDISNFNIIRDNVHDTINSIVNVDICRKKTCIQFGFLLHKPEQNMHIVFDSLPLPNTMIESLELYEQTIDISNDEYEIQSPKIITLSINAREGDKIYKHAIEVYYEADGMNKENACSLRIGKEYIYSKTC